MANHGEESRSGTDKVIKVDRSNLMKQSDTEEVNMGLVHRAGQRD